MCFEGSVVCMPVPSCRVPMLSAVGGFTASIRTLPCHAGGSQPWLSTVCFPTWQKVTATVLLAGDALNPIKDPQGPVFPGLLRTLSLGSLLPRQPAHGQLSTLAGLLPVPHRSLSSCLIPPESCSTWAPRVATCLWCSCRASAPWRTRPSAQTRCCSGKPLDTALSLWSPDTSQEFFSPGKSLGTGSETLSSLPVPHIENRHPLCQHCSPNRDLGSNLSPHLKVRKARPKMLV